MDCKIHVTSVVGGETISPPLTGSEALPEKIQAFSHYIKDTGCGSKQAAPYISDNQNWQKSLEQQDRQLIVTFMADIKCGWKLLF